jgi:hypothetical protein
MRWFRYFVFLASNTMLVGCLVFADYVAPQCIDDAECGYGSRCLEHKC